MSSKRRENPFLWTGAYTIGSLMGFAKGKATEAVASGNVRSVLRHLREAQAAWRDDQVGGRKARGGTPFCAAIDIIRNTPRSERYNSRKGFVYLIGDGDGLVKIGFATNVTLRHRTLQTSSANTLTVLLSLRGTPVDERRLHKQFETDRVRGEWFRLSAQIQKLIDDEAKGL